MSRRILIRVLKIAAVPVTAFVVGTFTLAWTAASGWVHPVRHVATKSPADLGQDYEDVVLHTEDGVRLVAWYLPSHNGAALILLHGISGNRSDLGGLAADLADAGYGVIMPDLRAHGESEGSTTSFGLYEVRDVRAALGYLLLRPDVDAERIGVYGVSLGGSVAIMSAAEIPQLKAVVADSTFASLEWVVRNQFSKLESIPSWIGPAELTLGGWQAGVDPSQVAPVDRIARISPRPILIIHGDADQTFLVGNAELNFEAAREPKELWIEPGVGHGGIWGKDPAAYTARVAAFFDSALLLAPFPLGGGLGEGRYA